MSGPAMPAQIGPKLLSDLLWVFGIGVLLPLSVAVELMAIVLHYLREAWRDLVCPT